LNVVTSAVAAAIFAFPLVMAALALPMSTNAVEVRPEFDDSRRFPSDH
jgi:hypothetical protein